MLDELKDAVVGTAIDSAMDAAQGKKEEKKQTAGQKTIRFFVTLVWVILAFLFSILGFVAMFAHEVLSLGERPAVGFLAIAIPLIFGIITFCVPYLRKKGSTTRWCGLMLLGDALWWAYIMFFGG